VSDESIRFPSTNYHGVFFNTETDFWEAEVETDEGPAVVGESMDEMEAARMYDAAAEDLEDDPQQNFV
jgi:hypothetical protein